jgi:membrane protease YdiL (CAAX protease family)
MSVFFNAEDHLRSGWRVGIYLIVLIGAFLLAGLALSFVVPLAVMESSQTALLGVNVAAQLAAAIAALVFLSRFVEHRPASSFGTSLHSRWGRDLLAGFVGAAVMLAVTLAASAVLGHVVIQRNTGSLGSEMLTMGVVLIGAAAFEELVFRGYPLQTLMGGIGTWPAIILMSALFGLAHINNPNVSWLGIINTILAGIWLSAAYLKTRSLWLPYGLHFAWNAGLGMILGFSLSGIDTKSVWITAATGSPTLLGGAYGPEGGLVGTIAFVVGIGLLQIWRRKPSIS